MNNITGTRRHHIIPRESNNGPPNVNRVFRDHQLQELEVTEIYREEVLGTLKRRVRLEFEKLLKSEEMQQSIFKCVISLVKSEINALNAYYFGSSSVVLIVVFVFGVMIGKWF